MSVSLWAYEPEKCDGDFCPGECDICILTFSEDEEDKSTTESSCEEDS